MPLSDPVRRKHIHTRRIYCEGFLREDGLWDIEGHITDTKTYPFDNEWRGHMTPGTPIHDMFIRITVDNEFVIHDVETVMEATPYQICSQVAPNFKRLIGEKIQGGWRRRTRELLGGAEGCTHLVELLGPVATVAFQTIRPYQRYLVKKSLEEGEEDTTGRRPWQINTCYGWSEKNEVVRRYLPDYYTGPNPPPPGQPNRAPEGDWGPTDTPESKPQP